MTAKRLPLVAANSRTAFSAKGKVGQTTIFFAGMRVDRGHHTRLALEFDSGGDSYQEASNFCISGR